MPKTSRELNEIKKHLEERIQRIDEQLNEIEIANAVAECSDIEELKKSIYQKFTQSTVFLNDRKPFDKLVEILPKNSYLCGYHENFWYSLEGGGKSYNTDYLLMLDEKTAVVFRLAEEYDKDREKLKRTVFTTNVYLGKETLKINTIRLQESNTSYVKIIDPSDNNYAPFKFLVDEDWYSLNGKDVVYVIGTVDLANLVQKTGEDNYLQKIKK